MYNCCSHIAPYFSLSVAIEVNVRQEWWPAVPDASQMAFCYVSSSRYEVDFYSSMMQHIIIRPEAIPCDTRILSETATTTHLTVLYPG